MLQEAKEVCPTTARRLANAGALLVDVREPREVKALAFDVPDLVNIPLLALETRWSELPQDRDIVLVCEGGGRSLKATYFLQFHGFTRVSNLSGGVLKWMQKGFPVIGQRLEAAACATGCCDTECAPSSAGAGTGCC